MTTFIFLNGKHTLRLFIFYAVFCKRRPKKFNIVDVANCVKALEFGGKNVSPKEKLIFSKGKGINTSTRRILPRFVVSPLVSWTKVVVVQHKKFSQKLTKTQKIMMEILRAMKKRQLLEEMLQEKLKEIDNLR